MYGERNTVFHAVTATAKNPLRKGFFMEPRDYQGIKLPKQSIDRTDPLPSPAHCSVFYLQTFQFCQIGKHSGM